MVCSLEITDIKGDRTTCLGQRVAQRQRMVVRDGAFDDLFDQRHGAIREALKPQDAGESDARGDALVELEADNIGAMRRGPFVGVLLYLLKSWQGIGNVGLLFLLLDSTV